MEKLTFNNKSDGHVGDVHYYSVDKLPESAKKIDNMPVAYGEKSGHIHINTGDVQLFKDDQGRIFAAVGEDGAYSQHIHQSRLTPDTWTINAPMEKADHKPEKLMPKTIYYISQHRRKKHFSKAWERVID